MRRRRSLNMRTLRFSAVLGMLLFGSLTASVLVRDLIAEAYPDLAQPFMSWLPESTGASLAIMAAASAAMAAGFYRLLSRFGLLRDRLSQARTPHLLPLRFARRDVARAAAVIFALWLPIIAIMYPTGITADTFNQLYQYQTSSPTFYPTTGTTVDAEFIDHHPAFDTLLYGAFWQIGAALGSQDAGIFALAVLQSAVLAVELGALVCYLDRLDVPYPLHAASLAFVALFPMFGHYAATVVKDTTYVTVFVPWAIMWAEIARSRGDALDGRAFFITFFLLGGLCVLAKKTGVYVLACCLAVLIIALKGRRAKCALGSAATMAVFVALLPAIVYPAVGGVAPGGRQEALGPAIQQMTALMREDPDALSAEELEAVQQVFRTKRAARLYEPYRSDGAKSTFKDTASTEDIANFLGVWAYQGLKHPGIYLMSTLQTSGMLYIPTMKMTYYSGDDMSGRASTYRKYNPEFDVDVAQPEELVALNDYLEFDSIESKVSDLPIISLFFTEGFYGGWVPMIALVTVLYARGGKRSADGAVSQPPMLVIGLVPTLLSVLTLLVSPVASPRYVLPLLFTAPLIMGWAWFALSTRASRKADAS